MYPKNRSSALLALLAAGGLYAWRNRDKIQGWINKNAPTSTDTTPASYPAFGETRRIGADGSGAEPSTNETSYGSGI